MATLRPARAEDVAAVTAIYNDAVARTTGTFDTEPKTLAQQREWFDRHGSSHPVLVAEEGGRVVAWASFSPWSDRCAYARTAEVSVYVEEPARGRGLAGELLDELLRRGRAAGIKQAMARITQDNESSLRLHARRGFVEVGLFKRVGEKFGRVLDVHVLQLSLEDAS
ncbi:MAG TPA: GNAT family N-acetyltransferase [Elusimicrobiota bacterium]|nr:GNAT family N-acetyltransferase [Elusimicrobiota bacterium]